MRQKRVMRNVLGLVLAVFLSHGAATRAHADAVTEWNAVMERTIAPSDPLNQVRAAAIAQVAVFEAVNSIVGEHEAYRSRIPAPADASAEAAAIVAAHRVLIGLYPQSAGLLNADRERSLAKVLDGPGKAAGIEVGEAAADAVLSLRENDGTKQNVPYSPMDLPGRWRPTPPDFTPAVMVGLGQVVTPFVIESGTRFRVRPPPALRSARYTKAYEEVKRVGAVDSTVRPQDRTDVARYYAITDVLQVWCPAARQVAEAQHTTLSENARAFALLTMAVFDAGIAVFETKYHYDFWRPVTAIRAGDTDGNRRTAADPDWLPLVPTPPFPAYVSGHGGLGAAARFVLEDAFGKRGHAIVLTNPQLPGIVLPYSSFREILDDIDDARIYGGIHWRFDQEESRGQGRRVASYVLRHALKPVAPGRKSVDAETPDATASR